jgi:hypothetical protein
MGWIEDPRFGKNLSRIQESKQHRIPGQDPQHCTKLRLINLQFQERNPVKSFVVLDFP